MELMSAEIFNGEIDLHFGSALCEIGFEKIKENLWVQDLGTGVRKVVTIIHWKGAQSTPRWGYSLDYVPHFDNSYKNIYWHRTNKSAMIDVFPFYFDFFKYSFYRLRSLEDHAKCIQECTPLMIKDMNDFYNLGSKTDDLAAILKKCESHKSSGLGFWNWSQLPLAYAFTLNKIGNEQKANEVLELFINRTDVASKVKQKLIERFNSMRA